MTALVERFPAGRTPTVRQCAGALLWSLGLVAFFGIWYLVETYGLALDWSYHLVHGVALVPMVIIGVPHVLIAYLFLATSRKMQSWRSFALLGGLTLLGIGLCWLYFSAGATAAASKIPVALVNFYFIVHHLRDEAFFYQVSGDAPANADRERIRRFLDAATWLFILVLLGVAAYFYDQHAHHQVPPRHGLLDYMFPPDLAYVWRALALALPMLLLVLWQLARWAKAEPGGVLVTLRRHRPMAVVGGLVLLVIATGAGLGSGTLLASIVLWHVIEWFMFGTRQAVRIEAEGRPATTWLQRVKGTRRGFLTLHVGLAVMVFVLMLFWAYSEGRAGPLTPVVSSDAFYYWTIMHVTVSFFPR